jgi:Rod binding domain-containing protein
MEIQNLNPAYARPGQGVPMDSKPEFRLKQLKQASTDFESMLLHQMFQSMQNTLQEGNLVGKGIAGSVYSGIMTEAVAKSMAQTQGLGVGEQLLQDVIRNDPTLRKYVQDALVSGGQNDAVQGTPAEPKSSEADKIADILGRETVEVLRRNFKGHPEAAASESIKRSEKS